MSSEKYIGYLELDIVQSIFSPAPWHGESVRMR